MCEVVATREGSSPVQVGERVTYEAHLDATVAGTADLTWHIVHDFADPGAARVIAPEILPEDSLQMSFVADRAGPYRVELSGRIGALACSSGSPEVINVRAPGANAATYRFRMTSAAAAGAAPDDVARTVWGGANHHHGDLIAAAEPLIAGGTLHDPSGAPLSAYIRVTPSEGGAALEIQSRALTGTYVVQFAPSTAYDVLVVPTDGRVAPARFTVNATADWLFTLPDGVAVTGTVTDRTGSPLANAAVAVHTGDLPAAAARTAVNGDFTLAAHPGAAEITVIPGKGAPELRLRTSATVPATGGTLDITYDSDLAVHTVAARVVDSGGAPVPGARVTWLGRDIADPAIVTASWAGPLAVTGSFRAAQISDSAGHLPAVELPAAQYDVIVDPRGHPGVATRLAVDLRTGPPPLQLALAPAARLTGRVVDADGAAVAEARIVATPRGPVAEIAPARTVTDTATGAFTLDVMAGQGYEITIAGRDLVHARRRIEATAPSRGQALSLGDVELGGVLRWTAVTRLQSGGRLPGVTVEIFCTACDTDEQTWPIARAVSDHAGLVVLPVPDPGTVE